MGDAIGNASGVDLNRASQDELDNVGGLGQERARRIVQGRPFRSWDDIKKLEGVSDELVEDLQRGGATLGKAA